MGRPIQYLLWEGSDLNVMVPNIYLRKIDFIRYKKFLCFTYEKISQGRQNIDYVPIIRIKLNYM